MQCAAAFRTIMQRSEVCRRCGVMRGERIGNGRSACIKTASDGGRGKHRNSSDALRWSILFTRRLLSPPPHHHPFAELTLHSAGCERT